MQTIAFALYLVIYLFTTLRTISEVFRQKHKNQILKRNRLQVCTILWSWNVSVVLAKSFACLLTAKSLIMFWKSIRFASSASMLNIARSFSLPWPIMILKKFLMSFRSLMLIKWVMLWFNVQVPLKISLSLCFTLTCLLITEFFATPSGPRPHGQWHAGFCSAGEANWDLAPQER